MKVNALFAIAVISFIAAILLIGDNGFDLSQTPSVILCIIGMIFLRLSGSSADR